MSKWIAGWNLPGCLPEMDPAEFDTEDEAWSWVKEEMESHSDAETFDSDFRVDPYFYWVEKCEAVLGEYKGDINHG